MRAWDINERPYLMVISDGELEREELAQRPEAPPAQRTTGHCQGIAHRHCTEVPFRERVFQCGQKVGLAEADSQDGPGSDVHGEDTIDTGLVPANCVLLLTLSVL